MSNTVGKVKIANYSTYNFNMTRDELKKLAEGLMSV